MRRWKGKKCAAVAVALSTQLGSWSENQSGKSRVPSLAGSLASALGFFEGLLWFARLDVIFASAIFCDVTRPKGEFEP